MERYKDPDLLIAKEQALQELLEAGIIDENLVVKIRKEDQELQMPKPAISIVNHLSISKDLSRAFGIDAAKAVMFDKDYLGGQPLEKFGEGIVLGVLQMIIPCSYRWLHSDEPGFIGSFLGSGVDLVTGVAVLLLLKDHPFEAVALKTVYNVGVNYAITGLSRLNQSLTHFIK